VDRIEGSLLRPDIDDPNRCRPCPTSKMHHPHALCLVNMPWCILHDTAFKVRQGLLPSKRDGVCRYQSVRRDGSGLLEDPTAATVHRGSPLTETCRAFRHYPQASTACRLALK